MQLHILHCVILLVRANLFLSVNIDLRNCECQFLRQLADRILIGGIPRQYHIDKLKLLGFNRITFRQSHNSLDFKPLSLEALYFYGQITEYLIVERITDTILHNNCRSVYILNDRDGILSRRGII